PKTSGVNVLVLARSLDTAVLERLAAALPAPKISPVFEPHFMTRAQIEKSLDSFPIEWLDIRERHLLLEGEDLVASLDVPRTYLRLPCEHELRGKHIQLRQALLLQARQPAALVRTLGAAASSLATLFR